MINLTIPEFHVIGISVRTTNENAQSGKDIPMLWNRFRSEGILEKIPGKIDNSVYCIYTEYEKDHTKPYTTLLGCRVNNLDKIPDGMTGKTFAEAEYSKRSVKGNILEGLVFNEWLRIWESDLDRTFVADFEIYNENEKDPTNMKVDIFIGVR